MFLNHFVYCENFKVWSCLTGSQDYHETKILQLAEKIKLIETIQNYLPVVPSPILQEMFKQTSYNKIKNINLEPVFYQIDSLLGMLKTWNSTLNLLIPGNYSFFYSCRLQISIKPNQTYRLRQSCYSLVDSSLSDSNFVTLY